MVRLEDTTFGEIGKFSRVLLPRHALRPYQLDAARASKTGSMVVGRERMLKELAEF